MSTNALPHTRTQSGSEDRILRYTLAERVVHWVAGLSYIYLLITGLAFWSPYLFWLADLVGGGPTARFGHPWMGLVWSVAIFWMYTAWREDMRTTPADRKWAKHVGDYIRNHDENLPPIGRFNIGQKQFFWLRGSDVACERYPLELALAALHCGSGACRGCTADNWRLYHPRLHGHRHGARRLYLDYPR